MNLFLNPAPPSSTAQVLSLSLTGPMPAASLRGLDVLDTGSFPSSGLLVLSGRFVTFSPSPLVWESSILDGSY